MLLNRNNLIIAKLASKDESRYTLTAIHATNKYTEVTDGQVLVQVTTPNMDPDSFPTWKDNSFTPSEHVDTLIPSNTALEAVKTIPGKSAMPILQNAAVQVTDTSVRIGTTDLNNYRVTEGQIPTGQFPNTERILEDCQKHEPLLKIGVDAALLKDLCSVLTSVLNRRRIITDSRSTPVMLTFTDANSAILLEGHNSQTGQYVTAMLMPLRLDKMGHCHQPGQAHEKTRAVR